MPTVGKDHLQELRIKIVSTKLLCTLQEMASLTSLPLDLFAGQILEAKAAEFRSLQIDKSFLQPYGPPVPPQEDIGSLERKRRFRGEESQTILALHQDDVPASAIAKRLRCSSMKVHRVIRNYEHSKTRVPESTHVIIRKGARAKSPRFNP
jgi:hypothetical protein